MNNTTNEKLRNVADVAARIMMGEKALHPNQQKLDVHEPEKDELTTKDFEMLRNKKKVKEEVESVEEADTLLARTGMNLPHKFPRPGQTNLGNIPVMNTPGNSKETDAYAEKRRGDRAKQLKPAIKAALGTHGPKGKLPEEVDLDEGKMGQLSADLKDLSHSSFVKEYGKPKSHYDSSNFKKPVQKGKEMDRAKSLAQRGMASMKKEEAETLDEYKSVDGVYKNKGTYGTEKSLEAGYTDFDKENKLAIKHLSPKKPVMKGARQNRNFNTKLYKEGFTELVYSYSENGLKGLFESLENNLIVEEPTSAEFDAEIKVAQDKSEGKGKKAEVAKAAVQAVQNEQTHTTVEVLDFDSVNGIQRSEIDLDEREMTKPEMEKKEDIVKGMKKSLTGFKERYGDQAKSVMYATATRIAKDKA